MRSFFFCIILLVARGTQCGFEILRLIAYHTRAPSEINWLNSGGLTIEVVQSLRHL